MPEPFDDPFVGRTIGQYHILGRIGGGGMGVVYTARAGRLGRTVALKFLPPQWSHDDTAKQRFVREAQAASATNHPNICTIHDIETADDGQLFIVMAYYDGETLKKRLESGPLPIDEALDIAMQVAEGLAKAHAQSVVHRDIKPGNLIVTEDGVRILDFGLATFADAVKLTTENAPVGTVAYMSPEQVRGLHADARADVWAVGAVLYEMLTGHPPFRGSHPEAVSFAIRNESPTPIRSERPEVPEEVEQLVFRALHKEVSVRYASGRELARALRQCRGLSVPMDLRTETVVPPVDVHPPPRPGPRPVLKRLVATAVLIVALAAGVWWVFQPVNRIVVAVMPVVNLTGYAELDALRLGFSQQLSSALADSTTVRVVGHEQLLSILRRFRAMGKDISSGEALQAVRENSGADVLIVVSLLNEGSGFKTRLEFRDSQAISGSEFQETAPEVSSLVKQAAFSLLPSTVDSIEQYGLRRSWRARAAHALRGVLGRRVVPTFPTRTLEGSASFEQGLEAYEQLEYVTARRRFEATVKQEPFSPVPLAWLSRVARVLGNEVDAEQFARRAVGALSDQTSQRDRLFVQAVAAEAQDDRAMALEKYRTLNELRRDDPASLLELAAFLDRDGRDNDEAIATYGRVLAAAGRFVRPHLELCRLYNRVNRPPDARMHGQQAVDAYAALGSDGDRAQALMCLSDSLRQGRDSDRRAAVEQAEAAVKILQDLKYPYGVSRALNYLALASEFEGRLDEAVKHWEQSLAAAQVAENRVLESLVRMNLGATHANLGDRALGLRYLRESATGFEALGDRSRAAESQFNIGALLLQYGGDAQEGQRLVQDSLEVFRDLMNRNFEVLSAHVMSTYYRYAARYKDADRELNRAFNLARERDLELRSVTTSIRLGQLRLDAADYEGARKVLEEPRPNATGPNQIETSLALARTYIRLGDFTTAERLLSEATRALVGITDPSLHLVLSVARGELAYETRQPDTARRYFGEAALRLTDQFPDIDALAAHAYVGLLAALRGDVAGGRATVAESLTLAKRAGYVSLAARCAVFLARIDIGQHRFDDAVRDLTDVPRDDDMRALDPELRGQVQIWLGRARKGKGDATRGSDEEALGRKMIDDLAARLEDAHRRSFLNRLTIQELVS